MPDPLAVVWDRILNNRIPYNISFGNSIFLDRLSFSPFACLFHSHFFSNAFTKERIRAKG
jgi:hypothetical protein